MSLLDEDPRQSGQRSRLYMVLFALGIICIILICSGLFFLLLSQQSPEEPLTEVPTVGPTVEIKVEPYRCDEPFMSTYRAYYESSAWVQVEEQSSLPNDTTTTKALPLPMEAPSVGLRVDGFLDLPFPYNGGNTSGGGTTEQFQQAVQWPVNGGRLINPFDSLYPLYPQNRFPTIAREPSEEPIAEHRLSFGRLQPAFSGYSGHPGLDFYPIIFGDTNTPVLAAADGQLTRVYAVPSTGNIIAEITHAPRPDGSVYQTRYMHLAPNDLANAGKRVQQGEQIGWMGNTGGGSEIHLHFEVRLDINEDGLFDAEEVVDPFGFIPTEAYPQNPWGNGADAFIDLNGQLVTPRSPNRYLWIHPSGHSAQVAESGGGQLRQPEPILTNALEETETAPNRNEITPSPILCAPQGALPAGATLNFAWLPDPIPANDKLGVGQSCVLSAFDISGVPISRFSKDVALALPFNETAIDKGSLRVYWIDNSGIAEVIAQTIYNGNVTVIEVSTPGFCFLMGKPTADIVAPITKFEVSPSAVSAAGVFYDEVEVSLTAIYLEPNNKETVATDLSRIEYELGDGIWQVYEEPFVIQPNGVPTSTDLPSISEGEPLVTGLGYFHIRARSIDNAGNIESPPAMRTIYIDPSQRPSDSEPDLVQPDSGYCTGEPNGIVSPSSANIRSGPGTDYDEQGKADVGAKLWITGWVPAKQGSTALPNDWYLAYLDLPNRGCIEGWVYAGFVELYVDKDQIPQIPDADIPPRPEVAPTITPTPPEVPPTITPTPSPTVVPPEEPLECGAYPDPYPCTPTPMPPTPIRPTPIPMCQGYGGYDCNDPIHPHVVRLWGVNDVIHWFVNGDGQVRNDMDGQVIELNGLRVGREGSSTVDDDAGYERTNYTLRVAFNNGAEEERELCRYHISNEWVEGQCVIAIEAPIPFEEQEKSMVSDTDGGSFAKLWQSLALFLSIIFFSVRHKRGRL